MRITQSLGRRYGRLSPCDHPSRPAPGTHQADALSALGQRVLGAMLLVLGLALTSTFWLLPVGLPLALLAVALLVAPPDQ